jgi:hypothetical protein
LRFALFNDISLTYQKKKEKKKKEKKEKKWELLSISVDFFR